jgi:hypothetical protein
MNLSQTCTAIVPLPHAGRRDGCWGTRGCDACALPPKSFEVQQHPIQGCRLRTTHHPHAAGLWFLGVRRCTGVSVRPSSGGCQLECNLHALPNLGATVTDDLLLVGEDVTHWCTGSKGWGHRRGQANVTTATPTYHPKQPGPNPPQTHSNRGRVRAAGGGGPSGPRASKHSNTLSRGVQHVTCGKSLAKPRQHAYEEEVLVRDHASDAATVLLRVYNLTVASPCTTAG